MAGEDLCLPIFYHQLSLMMIFAVVPQCRVWLVLVDISLLLHFKEPEVFIEPFIGAPACFSYVLGFSVLFGTDLAADSIYYRFLPAFDDLSLP